MEAQCVAVASSFDETINAVENNSADLILMDINLVGEKNGIDAANHIRTKNHIPIIFLTGNSDELFINKMKNIENSSFIIKPVSFDDLKSRVKETIG